MPEKYTYLAVDVLCILFPLLFSFHPRIKFHKQWRSFVIPCLATALIFIGWDIYFTRLNVWSFSQEYVTGIYLADLPLEEILFFICIPYACVFSYYCFKLFFKLSKFDKGIKVFYSLLGAALFITAILNLSKLYTSVTFISLDLFIVLLIVRKENFLSTFFFCYLFILIPFFISNGVLTGGFIDRVVVSYNPLHNLGIRLYTIPLEDIFYGMLLLLMNVAGFEWMQKRNKLVAK